MVELSAAGDRLGGCGRGYDRRMYFAVRLARGGPWDWSRDMREQAEFEEHARIMDAMVADGFIVLGGPLAGDREVLMVVCADSEQQVRGRLATDNWVRSGMLTIASVQAWRVLLDGRVTVSAERQPDVG